MWSISQFSRDIRLIPTALLLNSYTLRPEENHSIKDAENVGSFPLEVFSTLVYSSSLLFPQDFFIDTASRRIGH